MASASIFGDERKTFRPPPPPTPPPPAWIQCRGQTNNKKKLLTGTHESLRRRDTRQFIMSAQACAHRSRGCRGRRTAAYSKISAKTFSLRTPTTLKKKKKNWEKWGKSIKLTLAGTTYLRLTSSMVIPYVWSPTSMEKQSPSLAFKDLRNQQ